MALFVDNEQLVRVKDQFNRVMYLNSRISPETVISLDKMIPRYLDLHEVIIVGNNGEQVSTTPCYGNCTSTSLKLWVKSNVIGWLNSEISTLKPLKFELLFM